MSIYRRTDRVPLNDLAISGEQRPSGGRTSANEDWTNRRASEPANGLLKPTLSWAYALPAGRHPTALMTKYPRIANLLAVLWRDPVSLRGYIDDLLVDKRGHRQGFPLDVLQDIFDLRTLYDELHPPKLRPWEVMNKDE